MTFEMNRLLRYRPDEELTQREIKDLKDGVPNYPGGWVEVQGPNPLHEHMCGECTGSGVMLGYYPCRPCGGTGYIVPEPEYKPITPEAIQVAIDILDEIEKEKNRAFMDLVITGSTTIRKPQLEDIKNAWQELIKGVKVISKELANTPYPNSRELALLNARIATLKTQLSKELQKKKSERSQRDIKQLQQSINTLTKWKLPNKNSTRTGF